MGSAAIKVALLVLFLSGLVGAVLGVSGLQVHVIVAALIVASVSGLLLLGVRAESDDRLDRPRRVAG